MRYIVMKHGIRFGILGATGAVGREILALCETKKLPIKEIRLFASENSQGSSLGFNGQNIPLQVLQDNCFQGLDIVFFCAGGNISQKYAPSAVEQGAIVIDNSSVYRLDNNVPLIIPEVNPQALALHNGIIANPNCSTIIMLTALAPLHKKAKIKRIVAATYQAASGAGAKGMADLLEETKAYFEGSLYKRSIIPFPYAFNLFLHNSALKENCYSEEELKMVYETRKILNDDTIKITATCVRVPVLRAHSEALNVEFHMPIDEKEAKNILSSAPGVTILEDLALRRFPMPIDAIGKEGIFCGRIRKDISLDNTLDLWVVGDQLLKGAAQNAVQIAELILKENCCINYI